MDWTIDTNVLGQSARLDLDAIEFLNRIRRCGDYVVFDSSGYIEGEYNRCLKKAKEAKKPGAEVVGKWLRTLLDMNLIRHVYGPLTKKQRDGLCQLHFHDDDLPFVEACANSLDKRLITDDSDYSEVVKDYLMKELSICAQCYRECLDRL